jgi:dihydroxyacetone kinase-like protein
LSSTEKTLSIIKAMAGAMEENKKYLTRLDSEIGDGDHGNNMHRGSRDFTGRPGRERSI